MIRILKDIDLAPYAKYIQEYEEKSVLPIGPLDELRAKVLPGLAQRTGQTLEFIIREIYREMTIRSGYFATMERDTNGEVVGRQG